MDIKTKQLLEIEKDIKICKKCPLYQTATCAVAGEGSSNATIIFIGEAPGSQEDKEGKPFIGQAGKLLNKGLHNINITRDNIWIGNIIKHRPPNNRDPLPQEIEACKPYLTKQIEIINPKLIITLGRFALNYFVPETSITMSHGKLITKDSLKIYPLYHPAAALRNGDFMKAFVQDFLKIPAILEQVIKKVDNINEPNIVQTKFT